MELGNAECGVRNDRDHAPGNWEAERQIMSNENLKKRTKMFALEVVKFVEGLPKIETCRVLGRQLLRSGTSVGANYRAACRAKSSADFISKMGTVEEEADESAYWIELLMEASKVTEIKTAPLLKEVNELVAIAVSSINTARKSGGRQ